MRHLKTYEQNSNKPEIGDYVICKEITAYELNDFISNNIGKYISDNGRKYGYTPDFTHLVEYENVPGYMADMFDENLKNHKRNIRGMSFTEIIYWSKNKEDCEIYLDQKRYNL